MGLPEISRVTWQLWILTAVILILPIAAIVLSVTDICLSDANSCPCTLYLYELDTTKWGGLWKRLRHVTLEALQSSYFRRAFKWSFKSLHRLIIGSHPDIWSHIYTHWFAKNIKGSDNLRLEYNLANLILQDFGSSEHGQTGCWNHNNPLFDEYESIKVSTSCLI